MTEPSQSAHERARQAWTDLAQAGGISTAAQLAQRWGIQKRSVEELANTEGFPEPVLRESGRRWLTAEADEFRRRYVAGASGRPGRNPRPMGEG